MRGLAHYKTDRSALILPGRGLGSSAASLVADIWTHLGIVTHTATAGTATPTIANTPMGTASANRQILVIVNWYKFAAGLHQLTAATLGGHAGTRVVRANDANGTYNSEQWLFDIPDTEAATLGDLVFTKGGGAANPTWAMNVAVFEYVKGSQEASAAETDVDFQNAAEASVSITAAGEYTVGYGHAFGNTSIAFDGVTPDFLDVTSYALCTGSTDDWSRFGYGESTGALTIPMATNPGTQQYMSVVRWELVTP